MIQAGGFAARFTGDSSARGAAPSSLGEPLDLEMKRFTASKAGGTGGATHSGFASDSGGRTPTNRSFPAGCCASPAGKKRSRAQRYYPPQKRPPASPGHRTRRVPPRQPFLSAFFGQLSKSRNEGASARMGSPDRGDGDPDGF